MASGDKRFDAVIFDCDGTLVDSEALHNRALVEVLAEEGAVFTSEYAFHHWQGMTLNAIIADAEKKAGVLVSPDAIHRIVARAAQLIAEGAQPVPGALAAVERAARGHKVAVASNGERDTVRHSVHQCGFTPWLPAPVIFTRIDVTQGKPFPDLYLHAARAIGAAPSRCLVVEDSLSGAQAGLAAGMTVVGFTGVSHDPDFVGAQLTSAGVPHIASSYEDPVLWNLLD